MAEENKTTIIIKKIKKAGHGHHGGAWKVAYADFVTAMMAFFLVMWIVGLSQPAKEGIQKYFNDPLKYMFGSERAFMGVFDGNQGAAAVSSPDKGGVADSSKTGGIARLHLLAKDVENQMEPFKPDVYGFKVSPDKIQFAITAHALFSPGSVAMKPEAEPLLNRIADILRKITANIIIEAHTDDLKPENPEFPTNWELSSLRASTVVRFFVEGHQFDPSRMSALGASEYRPISDNRTTEGRAKNRRIDIYVIPDKEDAPQFRAPASTQEPQQDN